MKEERREWKLIFWELLIIKEKLTISGEKMMRKNNIRKKIKY